MCSGYSAHAAPHKGTKPHWNLVLKFQSPAPFWSNSTPVVCDEPPTPPNHRLRAYLRVLFLGRRPRPKATTLGGEIDERAVSGPVRQLEGGRVLCQSMVECNASTHTIAEILRKISAEERTLACYPSDVFQPTTRKLQQ